MKKWIRNSTGIVLNGIKGKVWYKSSATENGKIIENPSVETRGEKVRRDIPSKLQKESEEGSQKGCFIFEERFWYYREFV